MEATIETPQAKAPETAVLQAVEVMAVVDEKHNLRLNGPVPAGIEGNVRVIIIAQPTPATNAAPVDYDTSELTEEEWLRAASIWHAEDFANEPDLYTPEDGKPFHLEEGNDDKA